ncbi:MAG TPA: protein kinase, partial [Nannocystaceae bacterium]|nr:protein kinase [Nannocystaceae bacterium]
MSNDDPRGPKPPPPPRPGAPGTTRPIPVPVARDPSKPIGVPGPVARDASRPIGVPPPPPSRPPAAKTPMGVPTPTPGAMSSRPPPPPRPGAAPPPVLGPRPVPGAVMAPVPRDTTKPIASRTPTNLSTAPSRAPALAKPGVLSTPRPSAAANVKPANASGSPSAGAPALVSAPKPGARNERSRFRALHRMWRHPLGEVHGGTDATTGARVLVTALNAGAMINDRLLEAAQQLAHEAAILPTQFIAKPVDVQRLSDGRIGIATEALEGTPLTNVSRNQPMPPARVYAMLRQLCRALAVAHPAGVVHRAISLGSVLLRARADRPDSVVLTDFALGPLLDAELVVQKEDAALQPVTPERISGQERDAREDQYLLGCLGYTLLTGGAPFRTGTPDAVRRRHAIEDPMPITDRLRGARSVPVALAGWVHRCLAKEPDDRFDDVAELEAALCFAQIEDRVQTPWDDLPPPEVDASRR